MAIVAWFLKGLAYGLMAGGWVLGFGLTVIVAGSFFYGLINLAERMRDRRDGGGCEKE